MKTLLALLCAGITFTIGCALFNKDATPAEKAEELYRLSLGASSLGSSTDLAFNPSHTNAYLVAWTNLDASLHSATLSGTALRDIVKSLPIDGLKSKEAIIAIDGVTTLFYLTTGGNINIESNFVYVVAVGRGVKDGFGIVLHKQ